MLSIVLLSCLTLTAVQGDYTVEPQNIAVLSGAQVNLSCVSDSSTTVDWRFQSPTGSLLTLVKDCVLNPSYSCNYRLVNTGPGQCDLQVIQANNDRAGTYHCAAGFDPSVSLQLIVIASDPVCDVSPSSEQVYEGTNLTYTCRALYTPDLIRVSMTWTNSEGQSVQGSLYHGSGSTISSISVLATLPSLESYECLTVFNQPSGLPSTATNTPDYNHLWTSSSIIVVPEPPPIQPYNIAVGVGEIAILNCRRNIRTQKIAWTFVPVGTGGSSTIVAWDCVVVGAFSGLYRMDYTNDGLCNLIVTSVTKQLAGTYTCQDTATTDRMASAELIAIESDPICSQSSTGPSVPAGTSVLFTCTFHYYGGIKPIMQWRDSSGNYVPPISEHINTTIMVSTISVVATSPVVSHYTCQTIFSGLTDVLPSHIDAASNAPYYRSNWSSAEIPVYESDCSGILSNFPYSQSGVYTILVDGREIEVFCNMATDEGIGWTVIQRRIDGSQNFYRNYSDYESGFGDLEGEHWLGNVNIAAITSSRSYKLYIELGDFLGEYRYAAYSNFRVGNSSTLYTLESYGNYSGNAGNGLITLDKNPFTTYDMDNDSGNINCAENYRGAWWFGWCAESDLNGEYKPNNTIRYHGVLWIPWKGSFYSLRFSEMRITRN